MANPFFGFGKYQVDSVNKHYKSAGGSRRTETVKQETQEELELLALRAYLDSHRDILAGKKDKLAVTKKEEVKGIFRKKTKLTQTFVDVEVSKNERSHIFGKVNGQCFEAVVYSEKPNDMSIVSVKKCVNTNTLENEYQIHFVSGKGNYSKGMTYTKEQLPHSYQEIIKTALTQQKEETMNLV